MNADDIYLQRCQEAAVATRKLADLRAFFSCDIYSPEATSALDGLELDACRLMSEFLVNPYTPVDWKPLINTLEQLRMEAIDVYNADVLDLPEIDMHCLDSDEKMIETIEISDDDVDPSIVNQDEVHAEPYGRARNHSRRHVSDRLAQLLGEETFNRRLCRGKESAALAAITGIKSLKQCRIALSEAGLQKLYPNMAYLRSFDGYPCPKVSAVEFRRLVSRTLQLVTVSAHYRRSNGWTKTTDRSFYGSYAILALPEIFDSARAADIAEFITQHEPRPPPVTVDELRAAVAAAER
jgi:hypothetical protein